MKSHTVDWIFTGMTLAVFVVPILTSTFFNYPAQKKVSED
jgi:hypothetical protein